MEANEDRYKLGLYTHALSVFIGRSKFERDIKDMKEHTTQLVHDNLQQMRKVTLCLDFWTKGGMTSSFLGISACGFNPSNQLVQHLMLNLHRVPHPHTGEVIASVVSDTLNIWKINASKVMLVLTDNGSNMVKAFKQTFVQEPIIPLADESEPDSDSEDEIEDVPLDDSRITFRRLPCIAHTVQLVVIGCTQVSNGEDTSRLGKTGY